MVQKLLILASVLVFAVAWAARWWFWWRARDEGRRVECSMSVAELKGKLGLEVKKPNELRDAAALGSALRASGLDLLEKDGLVLAKSRRTGWWSLRILPGLLAVVLAFVVVTTRFPTYWALAVAFVVVAMHVVLRVSGLSIELRAVERAREELAKRGGFRRMSEEEAVVNCAKASVWDTILPW